MVESIVVTQDFNFGIVLLAAGKSGRMGEPKLLLPWDGSSILLHQIRTWTHLGAHQIGVVCAADDAAIQRELDRVESAACDRIINPQPQRGMFSSIQCAVTWPGWNSKLSHLVVSLADQPHLRLETLRTLLQFAAANPDKICQPRRFGHLRHPVILPKDIFRQLAECSATTLKEFLETTKEAIVGCDIDDPGMDFGIDTPADYERALADYR